MFKNLCVVIASVLALSSLSACVAPVRAVGDRDRDGVPNAVDRDRDGDGDVNRRDRRPDNPRR